MKIHGNIHVLYVILSWEGSALTWISINSDRFISNPNAPGVYELGPVSKAAAGNSLADEAEIS